MSPELPKQKLPKKFENPKNMFKNAGCVLPCDRVLRSNFNSRGVNSRELFWFFGQSSLSHHAILTKIGAFLSYKRPRAFYSLKT